LINSYGFDEDKGENDYTWVSLEHWLYHGIETHGTTRYGLAGSG